MIDKRVPSALAAVADVQNGATIMMAGFGGAGAPVVLMRALEAGSARDLTIIMNSLRALEGEAPAMFEDRRVVSAICSAFRGRGKGPSAYELQWQAGELEVELSPQGTFAERIRAGGAGIPAFYSPTAAGITLSDGKEVRDFNGRPAVLETALTADFTFLRAAEVDRMGNVRFHGSQANFGPAMATAAKVTIVETAEFSETVLTPDRIDLPGVYVNRVVVAPKTGDIGG
ncbi:MAG: CoA transferase subunit A [Alphaproteobacteria bacterium]